MLRCRILIRLPDAIGTAGECLRECSKCFAPAGALTNSTNVQRKSTLGGLKTTKHEKPICFSFFLDEKETKNQGCDLIRLLATFSKGEGKRMYILFRLKFVAMAENKQAPAFYLFPAFVGLTS
jgi:hypothetical protein